MFKVNGTDKKICEMVIGMIKKIEKFNSNKIDIMADDEFARVRLYYENIKEVTDDKKSPSITIKCYKLPTSSSIFINLNNPGFGYEHNIDVYSNEEPELFKEIVEALKYLGNLKIDNSIENAKVVIDNVFNKL